MAQFRIFFGNIPPPAGDVNGTLNQTLGELILTASGTITGGAGLPVDTFQKGTASLLAAIPLPDPGTPGSNLPSVRYFKSTRPKKSWNMGT